MRKTLAYSLIALGTLVATPTLTLTSVMAQGIYIGPNGVGVDPGIRHHRDDDRDGNYRRHDRDESYEGRSAYRPRYHEDDRY